MQINKLSKDDINRIIIAVSERNTYWLTRNAGDKIDRISHENLAREYGELENRLRRQFPEIAKEC